MARMVTMPVAYMTAIYAFDHVAHLKQGQSVLVQSAAKDIGLASVCLAKAKGADVFALVDTAEQAKFFEDELAMPSSRIIPTSSLPDLRRAAHMTRRGRFDVIVSTSRGELLHSLLEVLAPLGSLVDVGPVEVQVNPATSLALLRAHATYCPVDPFIILDSDPALGAELMQAVDSYYRERFIEPMQSITVSDVAQLAPALTIFSDVFGKLVVSFENAATLVRMIPPGPMVSFDPKACYVVTGAMGGLGQSLIRWMSDRGVRHLALLSRRDISSDAGAQGLVKSLAMRGTHVECFACDISKKDQVIRMVEQVSSSRPIRGIVHAAVSYLDVTFDNVSPSGWNESLSAKVQGTKNLHEATLSMSLDFFVMTTSALSVYAFATQGAYTAANNFQDAFARYRRQIGVPASTISFSLVGEVTKVGTDAITVDLFDRNKALTLSESQFLTLVEPAFLNNRTTDTPSSEQWFGQLEDPLSSANLHTYLDPSAMMDRKRAEITSEAAASAAAPRWYSDGRVSMMMRAFSDAQQQSVSGSLGEGPKNSVAHLRAEFEAAVREGATGRASTVTLVQNAIVNIVAEMLFVDVESIDPARSVASLGVDSLIAAELRLWFLKALGTNISMLDLLEPSVDIRTRAASITDEALAAKA